LSEVVWMGVLLVASLALAVVIVRAQSRPRALSAPQPNPAALRVETLVVDALVKGVGVLVVLAWVAACGLVGLAVLMWAWGIVFG
jgi:hypothetical protein